MSRFPRDAPRSQLFKALGKLGFEVVREGEHIALRRVNPDGSSTPMTIPNHRTYKSTTLRTILSRAGIPRERFVEVFYES